MTLFGGMSKGERARIQMRVRTAMSALAQDMTRYLGGRPSSSLSSEVSSAHDSKQRHSHRFLTPGDPALTIGCVKGGEAINVVTSKTPSTQPIGQSGSAG
jgi:hypothetical protein